MEIITSVVHDESRHNVVSFLKNEVKPFIIHLIDPKTIQSQHVAGKTIVQTIESIISRPWTTMLTIRGQLTGQFTPVELVDDAWVHVHLMVTGSRDRMVMLLSGQHSDLLTIDIGFVGNEDTFNKYMEMLNISQFEIHSNLIHYDQD